MTNKAIWLPLGLIVAAVVGLTGLFAPSAQAGGSAVVAVSSVSCTPGSTTCVVDLSVTPTGTLVGAMDATVDYDNTVLTATGCTAGTSVCNPSLDSDTVSFSMANPTGLTGNVGTITFTVAGADGTSSALTLTVTTCADEQGGTITCTETDGNVDVQAATPTPAPTAAPTGAPTGTTPAGTGAATATPGTLPDTGGDSGSSSMLPILLAAIGIAALGAGAWATSRLRRTSV